MTDLSPAARAVLNGFRAVPNLMDGPSIAGAIRQDVLDIAAELEASNG